MQVTSPLLPYTISPRVCTGHKDTHIESGQQSVRCPGESIFTNWVALKWMRLTDPIRFFISFVKFEWDIQRKAEDNRGVKLLRDTQKGSSKQKLWGCRTQG